MREFRESCRAHRSLKPQHLSLTAPEIGSIAYFPVWALRANQTRFSFASFKRKLAKGLEFEPDAYIDKKQDKWILPHDGAKAFYPPKKHIRAVFYRGELFVVDGHHRALISLYLGAESIPVQVIGNFSAMSPEAFREKMASEHLSYFRDYRGRPVAEVDWCELEDDPNLELARILIARVDVELSNGRLTTENLRSQKWSLGIKTDEDIPYLEFEVADALRRARVMWKEGRDPDLSKVKLERYLGILERAAERPNSRLDQVLLFEKPTKVKNLRLDKILLEHLKNIGCEALLGSPP